VEINHAYIVAAFEAKDELIIVKGHVHEKTKYGKKNHLFKMHLSTSCECEGIAVEWTVRGR